MGLIHLAFLIIFGVRLLLSSNSHMCASLFGSKVMGVLGMIMLYVLSMKNESLANFSVNLVLMRGSLSQSAACLEFNCSNSALLHVMEMATISTHSGWSISLSIATIISSTLIWIFWRLFLLRALLCTIIRICFTFLSRSSLSLRLTRVLGGWLGCTINMSLYVLMVLVICAVVSLTLVTLSSIPFTATLISSVFFVRELVALKICSWSVITLEILFSSVVYMPERLA